MLKTSEAWDKIAEAFARYADEGIESDHSDTGICVLAYRLRCWGDITSTQAVAMQLLGQEAAKEAWNCGHHGASFDAYLGPRDRENAGYRAMLATIYAEEAREQEAISETL